MTEIGKRVLVVDDEENVRNLLKRIMEERGYQVTTAADGKEALYYVSLGDIDLVLLDVKMPEISGIEVLKKITLDYPDICAIMVTSVVDTETAVEAMRLGAYDYIIKPFDRNDVLQKVLGAAEIWSRRLKEKQRYLKLQESIAEKTQKMQEQFVELINSLAREHKLMQELAARQQDGGKSVLSKLPKELQEPIPSVDEFRDALLKILRRT